MRAPVVVLVLGAALAVGLPTAWVVTRPGTAAGPPVATVLTTSPAPTPSTGTGPSAVPARPAAPAPVVPTARPVRLQLPGSDVDAPVDPVGVDADGAMAIPSDVGRVGWYRFGPAPGAAAGTAVLAGHVDDREQGLGVLSALRAVEPGAEVQVTDDAGVTTRWRVVSRELIDKEVLPRAELFARSGPPRLVLLTCGGPFLPELGSYRDNVVVVAEPVR